MDGAIQESQPAHVNRLAVRRLLLVAARRGGGWTFVLAAAGVAAAEAALLLPAVLGRTIDVVLAGGASAFWLASSAVLVVFLVACDAADDIATGAATAGSTAWLRRAVVRSILTGGVRRGQRVAPGDFTSRLVANTAEVGRVAPEILGAAASFLPSVGGTVALALIDPWLCLTFVVALPVFILLLRAFSRQASEVAARYLEAQGTIAARLVDALSGARTIAAAGTLGREEERILTPLPDLRRHGLGMWTAQTRIAAQDAVMVSLIEIAVLAVAGWQLSRARISLGDMVAATQYVLLATAFGPLVSIVTRLARAKAAAARVVDVLGNGSQAYGRETLPPGGGQVEFRGVAVRSGGRTVLAGIDLVIPAGALVGVVGRSGAGKSTLAALVGRLVDPDEGEVFLDGVPLSRLSRPELRRAVAYAFERPVLMGERLSDVIAFGRPISADEVVAAARASRADGFVRRLPQGYGTGLAEAPMSGGEVQRIGLARAFAQQSRVLVLDDVAASLDTVTEHHISRVLTTAMSDRTRIVVTHRASTAARLDFVIWLDAKRIRAVAAHDELRRDPDYRALFEPDEDPSGPAGRTVGAGVSS
jgi:ATP-binding cassette subfamily B protein